MTKPKLIRITTVPQSLVTLLAGQLGYMSRFYNVIAVSSPGDMLERAGREQGVETIAVKMTRSISPVSDLKALWKLYRLFRRERPLIVHTHTPKAGTLGMMAAWLARVPLRLHTVAGLPLLETSGMKRRVLDTVERITGRLAVRVYPNSWKLREIMIREKLCREDKLTVIADGSSNGIDTSYFDPALFSVVKRHELRTELGIGERDFVFVFIGRLVADKGIVELVEAFLRVSVSHPHARLLLVGPQEKELHPLPQDTLRAMVSNGRIISVGYRSDVRPYFAISDALAFPSYREGFPNVVMQAGAMGLPSIVTDINGCNEIVIGGENGIIIPPKDTATLQRAMEKMLGDTLLREKLAKNAREMITSRYERSRIWEALRAEYLRLEREYV